MSDSLRALKREVQDLRRRVAIARKTGQITPLSRWTIPGAERMKQEIETARRLGFDVQCAYQNNELVLTAWSRVQA